MLPKRKNQEKGNFKSNDEALELEKEVHAFFQSDASNEYKRLLGGYTESLRMICNGIREGGFNIGKEASIERGE